jgi:hypothetical protein
VPFSRMCRQMALAFIFQMDACASALNALKFVRKVLYVYDSLEMFPVHFHYWMNFKVVWLKC